MVFSTVIASLFNKFLSPFVDELTANQLNVFAWSGQVTLHNVSVKANAFDSLKLPFRIIHGHIGKIDASVPWMNIYSEPIVINISDVYVVAVPNSEIIYNEEEEKQYEWALKKSYLDNIESMKQKIKDELENKKEDDGFVMKLVVAAIKNIQIFINNVHICYEDSTTYKKHPLQVGVSFSKLVFETENGPGKKSSNEQIINKSIKLEGFSFYLNVKKIKRLNGLKFDQINEILKDRIATRNDNNNPDLEFILCPINFLSEAIIHRKPEVDFYKIPIADLNMNLDHFRVQLTNNQIHTLLLLLDSIDRMRSAAPYRKWRPHVSIKENPLSWWKFLFTAVVENGVRRKKKEFSWQNIQDACKKRKQYTELYRQKLLGENVPNLESYEKELNLITIVMARSKAELETKKILESRKKDSSKRGWFSGWWSSSTSSKNDDVIKNIKEEFNSEEKEKLYKAIGYEENALLQLYPPEYIAHRLNFNIKLFKISIKNENTNLANIEFNSCHFEFFNRPSSSNIFVKNDLDSLSIVGMNNVTILKGKQDKEFMSFKFEMNPLDKQFDFSIDLFMKSSYILYDIETIDQLYRMFKPPENISLEEIQSYAQYKLGDLKQMTALGLEYAIEKHKQLKLNIDVDPSFVIVPKLADLSKANSVLLLSLGKFLLTSKLVPKSNIPKVRDMMGKDQAGVMEEMKKLVYEKYFCHVQNIQVVLSDINHWKNDIEQLNTERHMIVPFEITLNISRSIIPQDPHFPKLILQGDIPLIEMKASDSQISQLLGLFITLPYGPTISELDVNSDQTDMLKAKNLKISKLNVLNNEVADAYTFATKAIGENEHVEIEKSKDGQDNVDGKSKDTSVHGPVVVYKNLTFDFKLKNIYLYMYKNDRGAESALARFHLDKFTLYGEILTDSTLWMNCAVSDLRLDDIRPNRKESGIRILLEKARNSQNESRSILTVYIAQKSTERVIVISMSGFSFILALDYLLAIIDVSTKAFTFTEDNLSVKSSEKVSNESKSKSPSQTKQDIVNIIEFDLKQMEVFILESLDVPNAAACIFTCYSNINLRLEQDVILITGQVSKIAMALANYLQYVNSSKVEAYIMSPTELNINGSIKGNRQMIDLSFADIYITISPQMVNVVLGILSAMGASSNVNPDETSHLESTSELLKIKPIDKKAWYLNCAPTAKEALDLIKPDISENNQIIFNMNSIKVLVKSSGSSQPLIRFSLSLLGKLIANKNLDFTISLTADYFNHALMAWEPFIEPVNGVVLQFKGHLSMEENYNKIKIEAIHNMEILLTKSSINVLYVISNAFSTVLSYSKSIDKQQENIVTIRNYMGIDLRVMTNSNIHPYEIGKDSLPIKRTFTKKIEIMQVIKSGEEFRFVTDDIANVKMTVQLIFSDSMVVERQIICQNSSSRAFFTSIKTYPFNENWKWIVQVHDTGSLSKEIQFQSNTQIVNSFDDAFHLYSYINNETNYVGKIEPLSTFYLPLKLVYGEELLYIRPNEQFELSENPVDWRCIELSDDAEADSCLSSICNPYPNQQSKLKYLMLQCWKKTDKTTSFNIKVRGDRFNVLFEDTEKLDNDDSHIFNIKLIPFVRMKNLLPYSIEFSYNPVEDDKVKLEPGEEFNLPYVIFGKTSVTFKVLNYLNRDWICREPLPESGKPNEDKYYHFVNPESGMGIYLTVNYSIEKSSLIMSLFAPYWMVNYTNEDITYRIDDKNTYFHEKTLSTPYLLCFDPEKVSKKDKLCLSISNSLHSSYFPLNVVPYNGSVMPQAKSKRYSYYVNVKVELARIGLSKIVAISSFYSVINISKQNIEYSENGEDWFLIETQRTKAFFPTRNEKETMCFRFAGTELTSKHISLRTSSQTLFSIRDKFLFVEIDVTEIEAKIKISDYFDGAAPVLIVNDLKQDITYGQKNVSKWDASDERHVKLLPAKSSVYFCWIEPLETREIVFKLNPTSNYDSIDLDFDRYVMVNDDFYWITFFDGKQRVLIFTKDHNLPQHLLKTEELTKPNLTLELIMKGLGVNIVNNEKKKDLLYLTINSTSLWEERKGESKRYKEFTIKENNILEELYQSYKLSITNSNAFVIKSNPHPEYQVDFATMRLLKPHRSELRRASNRGLWFLYSSSEHVKQYHIKINRIQIDNQLSDHIFDVAFSPVIVPKSISDTYDLQQKSFIEVSAIMQSLGSVTRYKYIQVLVQEFMVQVDWGWVILLMNVLDIETSKEDSNKIMITKDLENLFKNNTESEIQKFVMRKTYYDYLLLGPLKAHLSIAVGDLPDGKFPLGLDFIIRFTGLTIGEINDTLLKLDYFEKKMVFIADSELSNQVLDHYKTQVYMQFYKLLLGLDIIGNPMKLALGIKKGIGDFFYEPAVGIIQGPEEFAEGVANGVKSLASNVIGGTAGALGRIGNRLGTGVAALTIDDKFQKERRERINRKTGFAESGKNLFRGFISGVTGVITKPIEGAKEEGVEGLFKGVGRGVVGIVAQPATGVIDFASGSLHAFNNVIDPKQVAKPVRPPRSFKSSHEMTPYELPKAQGNQILRTLSEGKYSSEDYDFHLQLSNSCIVLLTKLKLFYLKKSVLTGTWDSDWIENWTNCVKVIQAPGKLRIVVKESKKTLLLFSGAKEHTIVTTNEDHLKELYKKILGHINPEDIAH